MRFSTAAVFIGADTPLGPLLFGAGYTQPSQWRFYLSFGRSFFETSAPTRLVWTRS